MIRVCAVLSLGVLLAGCHVPTSARSPQPPLAREGASGPVVRVSTGARAASAPARNVPEIQPRTLRSARGVTNPAAGVRCKEVQVESVGDPSGRPAAAGPRPSPESVRAAVAAAHDLVRAGDLDRGLDALEELHRSWPEVAGPVLATVLHQQALRHYGMGELEEAQRIWVRVAAADPAHPTARASWSAVQRERDGIEEGAPGLGARRPLPGAGPGG